jgi:hypothetical protein
MSRTEDKDGCGGEGRRNTEGSPKFGSKFVEQRMCYRFVTEVCRANNAL